MSMLPKKASFLAVKGRSRFPAAGSTAPLSSTGTAGGPSGLPHHIGFACAPGQLCPKDATSLSQLGYTHGCAPAEPSARCRVTATTMSHWHLSPHPVAWHAVPAWPLPHLEHLCYRLEPPWLCPGQQSQHECSTMTHGSRTLPCRNRHRIQVPKGPAQRHHATRYGDAGVQLAWSGQLPEGRGSPSPLPPGKGHGGFNGSLCAAPDQLY